MTSSTMNFTLAFCETEMVVPVKPEVASRVAMQDVVKLREVRQAMQRMSVAWGKKCPLRLRHRLVPDQHHRLPRIKIEQEDVPEDAGSGVLRLDGSDLGCLSKDEGGGEEAVKQRRMMEAEGVRPSRLTMSRLLAICSDWGIEDEAWEAVRYMEQEVGMSLSSENVGDLVELLASKGKLEEVRTVMKSVGLKALSVKTWMSLVRACRRCKEAELGAEAGEQVIKIEPMNAEVYLELASMYKEAGNRDKEVEVLARMEYRGIQPRGYTYQFR